MNMSLLIELRTEELPPKALQTLGNEFATSVFNGLVEQGLVSRDVKGGKIFATPRRLGLLVPDVAAQAAEREVIAKGPSVKAGLGADGKPSQALMGFAKKQGVDVDKLVRIHDGKQEVYAYRSMVRGANLADALASILEEATRKLPIPKMMRWGDSDSEFVRPVRGLVMMHGERVVPGTLLGQTSGRVTRGHRFLGKGEITVRSADDYEQQLEFEGSVIASFERRLETIRKSLNERAGGAAIAADEALYTEVAALVEYPAVYEAHFEKSFLEVPQECLMLTMKQNQKYFPLVDGRGKLLNRFLIVSNIDTKHPEQIIHGNERVLRARLADAKFFYDQDRREPLESRLPRLADVVYHNKLGSQLERVDRIERLAAAIAEKLKADATAARRAARLAKADLLTGMVGEFPELQGVMGAYYARHDGESEVVAAAIEAHYRPRFAGDKLPDDAIGDSVALAEKLDGLAGLFGIGQQPTGEKDPFGLRRAALGVLRILVEHAHPLAVDDLLNVAFAGFASKIPAAKVADAHKDLHTFLLDRLAGYMKERGYSTLEVEAVLSLRPVRVDLVPRMLEAARAFMALPEAESLAAANKRVANILRQAESKGEELKKVEAAGLREAAEKTLFETLQATSAKAKGLLDKGDFTGYLKTFAALKTPIDSFFDVVMVMAEDAALRRNRLALLADLRREMNRIADIAKLAQ